MARIARLVVPGLPHHIVQRGNRRQLTFFQDEDYRLYLSLLKEWCEKLDIGIWAYCLMPNHVHLIAVPSKEDTLSRAIGETHRRYTRHINFRHDWKGYLWQYRFASYTMDDRYTAAAARYIELNPVAAGIVHKAEDYPWSSAAAHLRLRDDAYVDAQALLAVMPDWRGLLENPGRSTDQGLLSAHERTGRPLGTDPFISDLERSLGKKLRKAKPGPKPKSKPN